MPNDNIQDKEKSAQKGSSADDGLKNVKAEMDRKFGNFEEKLVQTQQMNQQILEQLSKFTPQQPKQTAKEEPDDLEDLMYSNPKKYTEIIEERATKKAEERINKRLDNRDAAVNRQNEVLAKIAQDFPEATNAEHPLTQRAAEIMAGMSKEEKMNPAAARLAVVEAAAELGIPPKSKRKQDDSDDFVLPPGGGGEGSSRRGKKKINDATLVFASLMGLDTNDPKVVERIKARGSRDTWYKYR